MFEIHVTVKNADETLFEELCASQNCRAILIELPSTATHNLQLMCSKWVTGTLQDAKLAARAFSDAAREGGFVPVREKIEMAFSQAEDGFVPRRDKGEYWEFHYKLHLPSGGDRGAALEKNILDHHVWGKVARMSRSALRDVAPDGGIYRIVTLRLYEGDKGDARNACDDLRIFMENKGYNVVKIQRELSVYDDHLKLDDGWL